MHTPVKRQISVYLLTFWWKTIIPMMIDMIRQFDLKWFSISFWCAANVVGTSKKYRFSFFLVFMNLALNLEDLLATIFYLYFLLLSLALISTAKLLDKQFLTYSSILDIKPNHTAARAVACGTPDITYPSPDMHPLTTTLNCLFVRNSFIQFSILCFLF